VTHPCPVCGKPVRRVRADGGVLVTEAEGLPVVWRGMLIEALPLHRDCTRPAAAHEVAGRHTGTGSGY
jgi:hypothetical protein